MPIIGKQFGRIWAISAVNGQSFACSDKSKHVITRYWLATIGQVINDLVTAFSKDHQLGILPGNGMLMMKNVLLEIMHCFYHWPGRFNLVTHHFEFLEVLEINILYCYLVKQV